jgi:hypothetical protein
MDIYNEGYILCCFGDIIYFRLTKRLINNIRTYDKDRYICILTNDLSFFDEEYKNMNKVITKQFNYVDHISEIMKNNIDIDNDWNKHGLIPKLFHSYYTPFTYTMFLDVDMIFKTDFTFFWDKYFTNQPKLLFSGISDENNIAPPRWHWCTIDEVIKNSKINIPEFSGVFMVYDSKLKNYMEKYLNYIIENINNWKIKNWYKNGIPEEIIYAIIFGIENIKPDEEIFKWLYDQEYCDACNKHI